MAMGALDETDDHLYYVRLREWPGKFLEFAMIDIQGGCSLRLPLRRELS